MTFQIPVHVQEASSLPEAVQALSSILWGYTSKDCLEMLDKFFPIDH